VVDILVEQLLQQLPLKEDTLMRHLKKLVQTLHAHEQRSLLGSVLRVASQKFLHPTSQSWVLSELSRTPPDVAGTAALLQDFLSGNDGLTESLVELLTKPEASPLTTSQGLRRAVLAMLSLDNGELSSVSYLVPVNI
jgi:hypothetical protein